MKTLQAKLDSLLAKAKSLCEKHGVDAFQQTEYKRVATQIHNLREKIRINNK
jgi:hypothetical protein